ncbi:PREDICTED: protein NRT1/ PTR FAMILY 5.4 [Tarenaya hassleriana]|uniref:protein NRT1/ PTR FAMILY 5.4 n=1 Tax=Tarenaya hassleriana TaxID=28532 RepID=UPI00053C9618|nr:PREDICTED: protein NRT1/ PTR FAMILY 5.4 [Tarenaya hassleriana]
MADSDPKSVISDTKGITKKGGWTAALFITAVEVADSFAFYGLASNLMMFLTNELGQSTATAAKNINTWIGVSCIFPIVGAFLADSVLGRFKTVLLSSIVYLLGMAMLPISVSVVPRRLRDEMFFMALYVLAVGQGGHKPCIMTFAADQFGEENADQKMEKYSFFNWFYLAIVAGSSIAVLGLVFIQDRVSWAAGFGVVAGTVAVALILFLIGIPKYRKQLPVGSPFTRVAQVFVAAFKKWRVSTTPHRYSVCSEDSEDGSTSQTKTSGSKQYLARTNQFRFLDKATIIDEVDASDKTRNPWRLCSTNQVEEVKLVLRLVPIWLSLIMYCATIAQLNTFFNKQGSTMNRTIGKSFTIPPAAFTSVVGVTILVFVPLYDRVLVPAARKITKHHSGITVLQRVGIGLFIATLNMVICALVEARRLKVAKDHGLIDDPKAIVPMSSLWLLPQYILTGIGDTFTIVGMNILFYDQMPEIMRSIGAACFISVVGVGSFVSNVIISSVQSISKRRGEQWLGNNLNRAHLDYFYWVIASLNALSFFVYLVVAKRFVYKKLRGEDEEEEGHGSSSDPNYASAA